MQARESIIEKLLAPGGAAAEVFGASFEARPQQAQMARAVALAMQTKTHLMVEAGTGTGKSVAYLLPAALRCVLYGERVVVSTHTIALQEQLINKDIPLVQEIIKRLADSGRLPEPVTDDGKPKALKACLVKGRGNYVSVRRLKLASERQDRLFADPASRRSLHVIEDWAYGTEDGTLSTMPPIERWGVWDRVQSDSGNCMGKRCPNNAQCFFQNARREMEESNLLVCNHALFFSDLALRAQDAGFMPAYDHVVLDEAHNVEDVAGEHFGASLSEGRVQHLLTSLYAHRSGKGFLAGLATGTEAGAQSLAKTVTQVMQAGDTARAFFDDLLAFAQRSAQGGAKEGTWIERGTRAGGEPIVARVRTEDVVENALTRVMTDLALRLRGLRDDVPQDADKYELNAYALRAEMIAADAHTLIKQASPACAYWVEVGGGEDNASRRVTLACAPIEVAPLLKERLFGAGHSVVLTSATLATRSAENGRPAPGGFAHAAKQLGCDGCATMQLGSPFDYARQARVLVEPNAGRRGQESYARGLADAIARHVAETDGGAFVLFTSFATLNSVARAIGPRLEELGVPLLVQGRDGSRTEILDRFRADERSVLFGAASFWQGVDVRGRGLRNVIITKLPFDPPDRPLVQARGELIESRGGSPFMEDALPRAVLRFKQGFGRLIRSREDTGRVVILDERVVTTRYGRLFLQALPEGVRVEVVGAED
ncbi:MAG TPA: helicase C-terminal domain-containing protein [Phycisphaerales bacterium]|nr:helicase C-terminal domain-containing protein [Phycisphaerales bacterium]